MTGRRSLKENQDVSLCFSGSGSDKRIKFHCKVKKKNLKKKNHVLGSGSQNSFFYSQKLLSVEGSSEPKQIFIQNLP